MIKPVDNIVVDFKELVDYIKTKDEEIYILKSKLLDKSRRLECLKEEFDLVQNWLNENGIQLAIERNKVYRRWGDKNE